MSKRARRFDGTYYYYTVSEAFVDLPQNEIFSICKDICSKIKNSAIEKVNDRKFSIEGKIAKRFSLDPWYGITVEKIENRSKIYIRYVSGITRGSYDKKVDESKVETISRPAKNEFIEPFFTELLKTGIKTEVKTEVKKASNVGMRKF